MIRTLFPLDAAGRWRLAHDDLQWIVQRRKGPERQNKGAAFASPSGAAQITSEARNASCGGIFVSAGSF